MHYRFVIAAASVALAACTHPALARFRVEHDCPAASIRDLGAFAYQVEGCGRTVNYVCDPRDIGRMNRTVCIEERSWAHPGVVPPPPSTDRLPGRMELQEGRAGSGVAVRIVIPQLGGAVITYAPGVDREHVVARIPERFAARCADARIGAGSVLEVASRGGPGRFEWEREVFDEVARAAAVAIVACGRRLDVSGADLAVLRAFVDRASALSNPETPSGETAPGGEPRTADATTRAWLDGSRDAILGCASRETVIVRVEAREGGTTVSLQPPLAGGPEEACVRSALGDAPAGAAPQGVVIHAVR